MIQRAARESGSSSLPVALMAKTPSTEPANAQRTVATGTKGRNSPNSSPSSNRGRNRGRNGGRNGGRNSGRGGRNGGLHYSGGGRGPQWQNMQNLQNWAAWQNWAPWFVPPCPYPTARPNNATKPQ
ncbi:hypothetical protein A2U01_0057435, partial [Trifolium medium]|nr:hypothetical protein [Trifolium medium]